MDILGRFGVVALDMGVDIGGGRRRLVNSSSSFFKKGKKNENRV